MNTPLISVIVPVYKTEQYLKRCVDSILSQTYKNLEIILVDDGSPDNSGALCDELAKNDSRIRVVHKENGGLSSARNAGLDVMAGDFVGFVDSDDWIEAEMYQTLYTRMIDENAQISCCGIACTDGETVFSYFNNNQEEAFTVDKVSAMEMLLSNSKITNSVCDKLYDSKIFSKIRMKEKILYEDMQIQPYCIDLSERVTYTSKPMYNYYFSPESILRGKYTTRHYDCVKNSEERMEFILNKYPEIAKKAESKHLSICMDVIYKSRNDSDWDELRYKLVSIVKKPVSDGVVLSKKDVLKRRLIKISLKLFYAVMNFHYRKRK